jgi:hypothetical protein
MSLPERLIFLGFGFQPGWVTAITIVTNAASSKEALNICRGREAEMLIFWSISLDANIRNALALRRKDHI